MIAGLGVMLAALLAAPAANAAEFVQGPCPDNPALANARCGSLVVPENRTRPGSPNINLAVAIVPAQSPTPSADPVVHMAGGPGGVSVPLAGDLVDIGLNRDRDLILMDQRGTGSSQPGLFCPEVSRFKTRLLGMVYDAKSTGRKHVKATAKCHDRLVSEGVDVSAYNTTENAADFADLRTALGIAEWNVYGVSYGTDLALTYMRQHPAGIRSVTIDSVVPPDVASLGWTWSSAAEGINNLFRACAQQKRCDKAYPKLRRTFTGLVNQLEEDPATTKVLPTRTLAPSARGFAPNERVKVVTDGGALINWAFAITAVPTGIPAAIDALAGGNPKPVAKQRGFLASPSTVGGTAHGTTFSVLCSEWVPYEPPGEILEDGREAFPKYPDSVLAQAPQLPFMPDDCEVWDVPKAPESIRDTTRSPIPTLVISGSFDAVTGASWGRYAASNLSNSTFIEIPGVGHWVAIDSPCARGVLGSFLANPLGPDTACVADAKPKPFDVGRRAAARFEPPTLP